MKLQRYNNRLVNWSKRWRIQLSINKTKVIKFHRKRLRMKTVPGQTINGRRIPAVDQVEFLGLILDKQLNFKKQQQKILTELRRRTKIFATITGSVARPLVPTSISKKIFKAMIVPTTTYGCAATCIRNKQSFEKQDIWLRKAARLAIHAPRSTRNEYLYQELGLETSATITNRLATNYILNDARTDSIKEIVRACRNSTPPEQEPRTPLDVILSYKRKS